MAMPTKSAIVERAKELYAKDQWKQGCGDLADRTPEIQELAESGYLQAAKSELMRDSVRANLEGWKSYAKIEDFRDAEQQNDNNLKSLIENVINFGDLLLIANKGIGKTNSLMVLAQAFRKLKDTKVIIFEDFPKFCNEFEQISFMRIENDDVIQTKHEIDLGDYFLRHERDYTVNRGMKIKDFLENNKDCLFTMDISDIERSCFFIYSIVHYFYRKAYLRKYKGYSKKEHVIFVIEESQNVFDSSVVSKKIFNRLRKIFSVARNLDLHFILASQRLQDLNTKIRGRTRLLLGRPSLDDYELKVNRLLRHSRYRNGILAFDRGEFLNCSNDTIIKFPKFQQIGRPLEWLGCLTMQTVEIKAKPKTLFQKLFGRKTECSYKVTQYNNK